MVAKDVEQVKAAPARPTDEQLSALTDLSSISALMGDTGIIDASELGTGFELVEDKGRLIGVPLVFVHWTLKMGTFGWMCIAHVVQLDNTGTVIGKYVVTDGSTGICQQLTDITEASGRTSGLIAKHGLRVSEYDYTDEKTGETRPAKTYYINTNA